MIARYVLRGLVAMATVIVVSALYVGFRSTPRFVDEAADDTRLRGVFHVHSDSSHDGRRSASETLAGAAALGLDFVTFTEHNRNIRHPSRPGDPLAIPGTELSTNFGHLIYLGLESVPAEGVGRGPVGVPDSLTALGALTIPAHPSSPRRPWLGRRAGIGGLEIVSTSTAARVKADPFYNILPTLFAFAVNRRLGLAQLYARDEGALAIWDGFEDEAVVAMCGTDSHGYLDPEWELRTWTLQLDAWPDAPDPLSVEALVERLRTGRFACVAGLFAEGAIPFAFRASTAAGDIDQGGDVRAGEVSALVVEGPATTGGTLELVLLRDGEEVARTRERRLRHPAPEPGAWRVEGRLPIPRVVLGSRDVPVLYSNRILVRPDSVAASDAPASFAGAAGRE